MTNRLAGESSPYLLQHAHNPVDWYPWGAEALERARAENRPIFLSVGYSACHWCHVMERESFENPETAALMNRLFINIKVDREERPEIDAIYMDAVQAMTGQGGWPMSVFLTPDGRPYYGGTYYPPEPRFGMPAFRQVLIAVSEAWQKRPEQVAGQAQRLTEMLNRSASIEDPGDETGHAELAIILDEAAERLRQYFDEEEGGFGARPKFPQPMTLDFCLTQHHRTGSLDALLMAELTLEKMALGGIYDQLGGGFHRYSVDGEWLVPHFEKMLYDNAQLLRTYLHGWQVTQRPLFLKVVNETIEYVLREMLHPAGGFFSTQDADSEGEEGKFFVWSPAELDALLPPQQAVLAREVWGVTERGNFEGRTILSVVRTVEEAARRLNMPVADAEAALAAARATLFAARQQRVAPARDDKILTEWNGLMIHALAECGAALGHQPALDAAEAAASFVLARMSHNDGGLYRSWKDGRARFNAVLEDYAAFMRGLIALYEATFNLRWLAEASRLAQILFARFHDGANGGFFQTGLGHETLVARRKDYVDNAVPSGNSLAADALQRLAVLVGNLSYQREALRICRSVSASMAQQPTGFGRLLCVLNSLLSPSQEVVIVGAAGYADTLALLAEVHRRYLPTTTLAGKEPGADAPLPLLDGREMVNDRPAAYLCEGYVCRLPVTEAAALAAQLDARTPRPAQS